jgi:dTDP-4-dehydrorhamnose reductase
MLDDAPWTAADDLVVTPTYVPDLAHATLDLLLDGEGGLWHLAGDEAMTWAELARRAARLAGLDEALVEARPHAELGWPAPRPRFAALASRRGSVMPSSGGALERQVALCAGPRRRRLAAV